MRWRTIVIIHHHRGLTMVQVGDHVGGEPCVDVVGVDDLPFRRVAVLVGCEESYVALVSSAVSGFFGVFFGSGGTAVNQAVIQGKRRVDGASMAWTTPRLHEAS